MKNEDHWLHPFSCEMYGSEKYTASPFLPRNGDVGSPTQIIADYYSIDGVKAMLFYIIITLTSMIGLPLSVE